MCAAKTIIVNLNLTYNYIFACILIHVFIVIVIHDRSSHFNFED